MPTNKRYGVFTQAASDNVDFGQENNSQHVTNTVLYQRGEINTEQLRNKTPRKSIRRSLSIPSVPLEEFRSVAKPLLPVNYSSIRLADIFIDQKSETYQHSSSFTNAWILLRITGNKMFNLSEIQSVPAWTGFRKIVTTTISSPTAIGNCRSLPASPTDISVVYNMLKR